MFLYSIMICFIIGLVLIATGCDLWSPTSTSHLDRKSSSLAGDNNSIRKQLLHCFSAIRTVNEWLSTKASPVDDISCIHGIRVLSHLVVMFVHVSEGVFFQSRLNNRAKITQVSFCLYNRQRCFKSLSSLYKQS